MENQNRASILQMARGAIQERVDYEVCKAVDNSIKRGGFGLLFFVFRGGLL